MGSTMCSGRGGACRAGGGGRGGDLEFVVCDDEGDPVGGYLVRSRLKATTCCVQRGVV